jgi:hypoxanthine phosphoribosyltransferase
MQGDIERVLIDRQRIGQRIDELAEQITADLATLDAVPTPAGGPAIEVTLVPILTGSIIFVADLIRRLPQRMQIHVMSVSSYPGRSTTSQGVKIDPTLSAVPEDLTGLHVLVIDDILDSGRTLRRVREELARRGPASVRTCVLLRKQLDQPPEAEADYVGFDIPDAFVVGYGLDFDDYYRNLPDIVTLRPDVIASHGAAP